MSTTRLAYVDVYGYRGAGDSMEFLVLRRAQGRSRAGSWEGVHGSVEPGEHPVAAARREFAEESGSVPRRLYNLSRVEQFYLAESDEVVLVPVFAAELALTDTVTLSAEHDRADWLPPEAAMARCTWPRAARAIADAVRLLGSGSAGPVDDVLRS